MNKAELESKHLSELHALAADAGVERYRMLPRAELIEKLAGGEGGGSGGGGSSQRSRPPRERKERSSRGGGRDRQRRSGGDRSSRGGGGERQPRGGGGDRQPRGGGERRPRRPESEKREQPEREQARTPAPGGEESGKPKRRRRRRFRKGGKSIGAGELILAAPGGQSIVYGESRQSCTSLLRELAAELSGGRGPDPIALLIDPSPEELADWKREAPKAEIVSAGQDRHAEDALAQAARRAEAGEAVILLVDSVSRLAESFGSNVAKDLLEAGRAAAGSGSGSLTVVAAVERS